MKLFIYLFGIVMFFGSCEDKKKASHNENEIKKEIKNEVEVEKKAEPEYPEITNENVVSFLTEYGKNNPETNLVSKVCFNWVGGK